MWRVCAVAATAAALQAPLSKRPGTKVDVSTLEAPAERVVVPSQRPEGERAQDVR